jgi:LysM repeat protein
MPGTLSNCTCFLILHGYDSGCKKEKFHYTQPSYSAANCLTPATIAYDCEDIESDYSLSVDQLTTWNTWLSPDCDTNLYANLSSSDTRAVCVGLNATTAVGTSTSSPPGTISGPTTTSLTTTSSPTTTTSTSMGPTPSGEIAGCQAYYTVQSDDSCPSIEAAYGITFFQFFGWNPISMF